MNLNMNKMKISAVFAIGLASGVFGSIEAYAATHNLKSGQVYVGQETHNEQLTGKKCYITIQGVQALPDKGLHCHVVDFQFSSVRDDVPKEVLKVDSRLTNRHRSEFPQIRTCAMNIDGTTWGPEIYEDDTSVLYNQILGGTHTAGSVRYDYFLTLSPDTKLAVRSRVHVTKTFNEYDIDCVNLELM